MFKFQATFDLIFFCSSWSVINAILTNHRGDTLENVRRKNQQNQQNHQKHQILRVKEDKWFDHCYTLDLLNASV